jgi:glycine/D-amino acid oxidase-like deaminating enzyme
MPPSPKPTGTRRSHWPTSWPDTLWRVKDYRTVSLWFDGLDETVTARPALAASSTTDVAIVGAGLTGLWTAYYLQQADPSLRITVLESEVAGFGASGRNGGWCSALYPVHASTLAGEVGHEAAAAQYHAMVDTVGEVVRVTATEGLEADIALGGTVTLARSVPQLARAEAEVAEAREFGLDVDLLDAPAASGLLNATGVLGGTYTPHCAALQPAKLVRGLARLVEDRGARLLEQTRVLRIEAGQAHTDRGTVRAKVVVRATEGYTARLTGQRRAIAPVYSLIIATQPLSDAIWDEIGLGRRETFTDLRHLIIYGQRTADNRMVFGGRGAPYHLGSRISGRFDRNPKVFELLHQSLLELFPVLAGAAITHRWGGPLGIARDWHASVGLSDGLAWAGGYVGDGVSTTNLAGRTLADLITGRDSAITSLPWVGHRSRNWEPEPLRWMGANAGLRAMTLADHAEARGGRPSRVAGLVNALMGR